MPSEPHDPRSILPPPDPPFRGEINVAFSDSKPDFPEPLRAPDGAPNVTGTLAQVTIEAKVTP